MKYIIGIFMLFLVTGCYKKAESSSAVGGEFVVEKLFTHEGCTVYRFADGGGTRYFTNCNGATSWTESCGKNCSRQVGID